MIRLGVLLALALLLTACGPRGERDPFTDSRTPPSLGPAYWPPQGWAWGLIQLGAGPPQRYGVAAPMDEAPVAQVLMLPGYGGTAEEDFAAANALIDRRVQVWALDGVGQGGSGRIALPRDLGHLESFDGDVEGLRQLLAGVVRPTPAAPLVAVADGTAAAVLLRALQRGAPQVSAVVLTEPRVDPHSTADPRLRPMPRWARRLGLDRRRASGGQAWAPRRRHRAGRLARLRAARLAGGQPRPADGRPEPRLAGRVRPAHR